MIAFALRALREYPETFAEHLQHVPPAALDFAPASWDGCPSETMTIRQQVCHVRDLEIDGWTRFSRPLREEAPFLESIDRYALIHERRYDSIPVEEALAAFSEGRRQTVRLLETLSPDDLARKATLEGLGQVTILGLARFRISHDQQHLAGVEWLLGKFESAA